MANSSDNYSSIDITTTDEEPDVRLQFSHRVHNNKNNEEEEEEEETLGSDSGSSREETPGFIESTLEHAKQLYRELGWRFCSLLVIIKWLLKAFMAGGGDSGVLGAPVILMLSEYSRSGVVTPSDIITPARVQVLESLVFSAWCLKPITSLLMENLYIGGYNKIPYIILTTITAIISCIGLFGLYRAISPETLTFLIFLIFLQITTADILLRSKTAQKTSLSPELRPALVTIMTLGHDLFRLSAIVLVGILLACRVPLNYFYLIPLPILIVLLWPIYNNWLEDNERLDAQGHERLINVVMPRLTNVCCGQLLTYRPRHPTYAIDPDAESSVILTSIPGLKSSSVAASTGDAGPVPQHGRLSSLVVNRIPVFGFNTMRVSKQWRLSLLATLIGLAALVNMLLGITGHANTGILLAFSLTGTVILIITHLFLHQSRVVSYIHVFVLLKSVCHLNIRAATYRFFTDPASIYPAGPHFTREFYIGTLGTISVACSIVGVLLYKRFMTHWSYRRVFQIAIALGALAHITNPILYSRQNLVYGFPDLDLALLSEVMQAVIGTLEEMPCTILLLSLARPGTEVVSMAVFSGTINLGNTFAAYQGAYVLDRLGIGTAATPVAAAEAIQFTNLWIASLISIGLRLLPLIFLDKLVPNHITQDSDLYTPEEKRLYMRDNLPPDIVEYCDAAGDDTGSSSTLLHGAPNKPPLSDVCPDTTPPPLSSHRLTREELLDSSIRRLQQPITY